MSTYKSGPANWANEHFGRVPLGDIRRTDRLVKFSEALSKKPGSSLPKLGQTWYATKATYNLLKHKYMKPDIIQSSHRILVGDDLAPFFGPLASRGSGSFFLISY